MNAAEYQERASTARGAVTRGDLVPLFSDLPDASAADEPPVRPSAAPAAAAGAAGITGAAGDPSGSWAPSEATGESRGAAGSWGSMRPLGGAVGATIMALVPFLALGLFFLFGFVGSFAWSWLFFALVPIAGIIIYGAGAQERRSPP